MTDQRMRLQRTCRVIWIGGMVFWSHLIFDDELVGDYLDELPKSLSIGVALVLVFVPPLAAIADLAINWSAFRPFVLRHWTAFTSLCLVGAGYHLLANGRGDFEEAVGAVFLALAGILLFQYAVREFKRR